MYILNYGFLQIYVQEWDCWIIWYELLIFYLHTFPDLILSPGFSIPFICCQLPHFISSPNFSTKFLAYKQLNTSTWYLIGISNFIFKLDLIFPPNVLLPVLPLSVNGNCTFPGEAQKFNSHHWLLSFSHIAHPICQQISLALLLQEIQNATTSFHSHCYSGPSHN